MDHHPPPPPPPPLTGPAAAPPPGCGAVSCIRRPQRSDMAVLRRGGRRTGVCWPQPQARSRTATPARCTGVSRTRCHQVCRRCAAALHVAAAQRRGLPAALSSRRDAPATLAAAHAARPVASVIWRLSQRARRARWSGGVAVGSTHSRGGRGLIPRRGCTTLRQPLFTCRTGLGTARLATADVSLGRKTWPVHPPSSPPAAGGVAQCWKCRRAAYVGV